MRKLVVTLLVGTFILIGTMSAAAQESDPWLPGLASLIIPGAGQLINDQMDRALLHFGVGLGINVGTWIVAAVVPYGAGLVLLPIGGLAYLGWAVYSAFDAYGVAKDQGFTIGLVDNGIGFAYSF